MQRKVNVMDDLDGNKIVVIHDIIFKGKRSMEWTDVDLKRIVKINMRRMQNTDGIRL